MITKRCCKIADNNAVRRTKPVVLLSRTIFFINLITMRAIFSGIPRIYQGQPDKLKTVEQLLNINRLMRQIIAYLSNDLPDLLSILKVGLSVEKSPFSSIINKGHRMISINGGSDAVLEHYHSILWAHKLNEVKGLPA